MAKHSAKELQLRVIPASMASAFIAEHHYSGKSTQNSQLHFGVFWQESLAGAIQLGPALCKDHSIGLVKGTGWNEFLELNRLAFSSALPRNSESRALAVCMRLIRRNAPHIKWVQSFADVTRCGDGTIYRASGFHLTDIRRNKDLIQNPQTGEIVHSITTRVSQKYVGQGKKTFKDWKPVPGFQLRYIYFLHRNEIENLTVPILPFSAIKEAGASMYLGQRVGSIDSDVPGLQPDQGGANPTPTLHKSQ